MRHGAGTFVQALAMEQRSAERERQARDLVRGMLAEAARQGLGGAELLSALRAEVGESADA
jgi:DNA-binding transcriptional regulator YhcF (GntR family)